MLVDQPLSTRAQEVLYSIVRTYIETGEPVGSRTLARLRRDNLSPASIRNTMADLADEGYLSQPHTSAGRIPTEKAFRLYARSLASRKISPVEAERLSFAASSASDSTCTLPFRRYAICSSMLRARTAMGGRL